MGRRGPQKSEDRIYTPSREEDIIILVHSPSDQMFKCNDTYTVKDNQEFLGTRRHKRKQAQNKTLETDPRRLRHSHHRKTLLKSMKEELEGLCRETGNKM